MRALLKRIAAALPGRLETDLKRHYFRGQIRRGTFRPDEPDYYRLHELIAPGDWVIDVGANVGQYTLKFSELVSAEGRVLAFEPIPVTFELLASNCLLFPCRNVTLLNLAASNQVGVVRMDVPEWTPGRLNFYRARISGGPTGKQQYSVVAVPIDSLQLPCRVGLVKIDAENHELEVVQGMANLIRRDHPIVISEGSLAVGFLESCGYVTERLPGSPNSISRYVA